MQTEDKMSLLLAEEFIHDTTSQDHLKNNSFVNLLHRAQQSLLDHRNISISLNELRSGAALTGRVAIIFIFCFTFLSLTNVFVFINIQASKKLKNTTVFRQIQFLAVIDGTACLLMTYGDAALLFSDSALVSSTPEGEAELNNICRWLGAVIFFLFFASANCQAYIAISRFHAVLSIKPHGYYSAAPLSAIESPNSRSSTSSNNIGARNIFRSKTTAIKNWWSASPTNEASINICRWVSFVLIFPGSIMILAALHIWGGFSVMPTYGVCRPNLDRSPWKIFLDVVFIFGPLVIMFVCYSGIYISLWGLSKGSAKAVAFRATAQRRANMSMTMFLCFMMFIICGIPAPVVHQTNHVYWLRGPDIYGVTGWFVLNMCLNGYIYLFFNRMFRRETINLLRLLYYRYRHALLTSRKAVESAGRCHHSSSVSPQGAAVSSTLLSVGQQSVNSTQYHDLSRTENESFV